MADHQEIAELEGAISKGRARYDAELTQLAQSMPFTGSIVPARELVSHVGEFGIERTVDAAKRDPRFLGLTQPLTDTQRQWLDSLAACSAELDALIARREAILSLTDPTRPRRFHLHGREFTVHPDGHHIMFDDTREMAPLELVSTGDAPTRRRRRERER